MKQGTKTVYSLCEIRKNIRGYSFMPTCSTWGKSPWNTVETMEYYRKNMPSREQLSVS